MLLGWDELRRSVDRRIAGCVLGIEAAWFNPIASWVSWLMPLAVFELRDFYKRRNSRAPAQAISTLISHALQRRA